MREAIPGSELSAHIEKSYSYFRAACKKYRSGFLTEDELRRHFQWELQEGFFDYLSSKKVRTEFSDASWSRFLKDYDLWKAGKQPCSLLGSPWLVYDDSEEVSVLDKNSFFRLMDAYCILPSYFKPIPDSCIRPKHQLKMYGTGMTGTVRFDLADDGGMYSCDSPIGKTFTLTDEYGLRAIILIERTGKKDEIHNLMDPQYVGRGTIEGYTSSRPREIFISEREGNTVWFWIHVGNDDYDVLHHFPLWEHYNEYVADWQKRSCAHLHGLINYFDETFS